MQRCWVKWNIRWTGIREGSVSVGGDIVNVAGKEAGDENWIVDDSCRKTNPDKVDGIDVGAKWSMDGGW